MPEPMSAHRVEVNPLAFARVVQVKSWTRPPAADRLPTRWPMRVGETSAGPPRVFCLAPAEWLLLSYEHDAPESRELASQFVEERTLACAELTDALAAFEVRGDAARDLLSKACGLDLHPRSFPAGRCARTRFAQIAAIIHARDESPTFELFVARSYEHYLRSWIADAALEFTRQPLDALALPR